jgi:hypothetical protein
VLQLTVVCEGRGADSYQLEATPWTQVWTLKEKVRQAARRPAGAVRLFLGQRELVSQKLLADYHQLESGCTLRAIWPAHNRFGGRVTAREKEIGGSRGSLEPPGPLLEPPGPLLTHLRTVCMAHSECLPTRLNPLAERACFSQVTALSAAGAADPACDELCPRRPGAVKRH